MRIIYYVFKRILKRQALHDLRRVTKLSVEHLLFDKYFVAGAMDTENSGGQSESLSLTALEAVSPSEERDEKCSRRSLVRE